MTLLAAGTNAGATPTLASVLLAAIPVLAAVVAACIAGVFALAAKRAESGSVRIEASQQRKDQRLAGLEDRNADRKFASYEPMIDLLRRRIDPDELPALQQEAAAHQAQSSKFAAWLSIFGSDEAVIAYQRMMQAQFNEAPPNIQVRYYVDFLLAARRDIANPETSVEAVHILGLRWRDIYESDLLRELLSTPTEQHALHGWAPPWESSEG